LWISQILSTGSTVYGVYKYPEKHCIQLGSLLDKNLAVEKWFGFAQTMLWIFNSLSTGAGFDRHVELTFMQRFLYVGVNQVF
jgi:hypothetical protein